MLPRPFDTREILQGLMSHGIRVESIACIHDINSKWPKVHPDIPLFRFDPPDAHNSLRWDCVGNGIFTQKTRKRQQRTWTVMHTVK